MKNETTQPSATEQALAKIEFTDAKAFESIVAAISSLADKYRGLKITDTKSYKAVVGGIAEMRGLRIAVENRRKEKKADILAAGRQIDGGAKKIAELLWPIENELKKTKDTEDARKDAIRIEKEQAEKERIESIQSKIAAFPPDVSKLPQLLKMTASEIQEIHNALSATEIDIEIYQEFTPEAIKAKTDKSKLLQEYYIARITADAEIAKQKAEAERQEQARKVQEEAFKVEQERLEKERLAKIEAQRIIDEKAEKEREAEAERQEAALKKQEEEQKARQKIEDDRLAEIKEKQEAEAEKLRISQAEIETQKQVLQKEYDRLENERLERERTEQERLAQIERDRLAKIEADKQEKLRIEQEAEEKAEREKAEAEEKTRQEAVRPDQEAIALYLDDLSAKINMSKKPLMKTPEGKVVLSFIQTQIEKVFVDSLKKLGEM